MEEKSLKHQREKNEAWERGIAKTTTEGDLGDGESTNENAEHDPEFKASFEQETTRVIFPSKPTRTSRYKLDEDIARTFCECVSEFNISEEQARGFFVKVANGVFHQNWELESDFEGEGKKAPVEEAAKKRRRAVPDLSMRFPSADACKKWLLAAHIMPLRYVGKKLMERGDDVVATFGFDDTRKAAGHRVHDAKTNHITLKSTADALYKETFTLGMLENVKHTGKAGAESLRHSFKGLAVLCDSTPQDIQDLFDFYQSDRAGDTTLCLDELGIEDDKRLKCCPHMLLCIDEACDKVFREHEGRIGFSKLLEVQSPRWNVASKSTSILTLVQVACSKLLSPSHANGTISLYVEFSNFLVDKDVKNGFRGFVSNRFGRRAALSIEYLRM